MVLRLATIVLALSTLPAEATSRGTKIAMAVALLDVAEEYCAGRMSVDAAEKTRLMEHFHEYDIAGLASILSQPLNTPSTRTSCMRRGRPRQLLQRGASARARHRLSGDQGGVAGGVPHFLFRAEGRGRSRDTQGIPHAVRSARRRARVLFSDEFYYLSRTALVKDERNLDRFDRVFAHVFKGIGSAAEALLAEIPEDWLRKLAEKHLTEEEKRLVQALGGLDRILEELKKRLDEQKGRHQGGSKWIGTAGTSPFGAHGYNPAGVRIGQDLNRNNSAVKVWDRRDFKDLDDTLELGTRNIKIALRRLRRFAREGAAEELDLDGTIRRRRARAGSTCS